MTRMDDAIERNGVEATIHRDTGSVTNDYGDITPIWGTAVATEYVWLQRTKQGGNTPGMPGIIDRAPYVIMMISTTEGQDLDLVKIGSSYYRIEKLNPVDQYSSEISHYEADSRLVEEG